MPCNHLECSEVCYVSIWKSTRFADRTPVPTVPSMSIICKRESHEMGTVLQDHQFSIKVLTGKDHVGAKVLSCMKYYKYRMICI